MSPDCHWPFRPNLVNCFVEHWALAFLFSPLIWPTVAAAVAEWELHTNAHCPLLWLPSDFNYHIRQQGYEPGIDLAQFTYQSERGQLPVAHPNTRATSSSSKCSKSSSSSTTNKRSRCWPWVKPELLAIYSSQWLGCDVDATAAASPLALMLFTCTTFCCFVFCFLFATLRVCCSSSWCDCCCWDFGCCCCKWCCWCASAHCTGQVLSVGIKITWHVISLAFLSPVASLVDRCVWPPSENEKVPQWWMPLCLRLLLQLEVLFLWLYNVSQTGSSLVLAPLRGMSITWTWLYNLHNGQEWKEVDLKRYELSYRERSTLLYAEIGWNFQRR